MTENPTLSDLVDATLAAELTQGDNHGMNLRLKYQENYDKTILHAVALYMSRNQGKVPTLQDWPQPQAGQIARITSLGYGSYTNFLKKHGFKTNNDSYTQAPTKQQPERKTYESTNENPSIVQYNLEQKDILTDRVPRGFNQNQEAFTTAVKRMMEKYDLEELPRTSSLEGYSKVVQSIHMNFGGFDKYAAVSGIKVASARRKSRNTITSSQ
jgi:hypothetical protein